MKKIIYIVLIVFMSGLYSCSKDLGNYDYKDINEVEIANFPTEKAFRIRHADYLKVSPTISGDDSNYEYCWVALLNTQKKDTTVIGTARELDYLVTLPQGDYFVSLNVFDKTTDVSWSKTFELNVTSTTTSGWIVLTERNSEAVLDMISVVGDREFYIRDILAGSDLPFKRDPIGLSLIKDLNVFKINLLTKNGPISLNPETLLWDPALELKYEMGIMPKDFAPVKSEYWSSSASFGRIAIISGGNLYTKNSVAYKPLYGFPANYTDKDSKLFNVSSYFLTCYSPIRTESPALVYDTDNKRFMQLERDFTKCKEAKATNSVFSMTTGKDLLFTSNSRQSFGGKSFALLKGVDNKVWVYGFEFGPFNPTSFSQLANFYYQIDAPEIENATKFAIHLYDTFLFYVVGNKVYQFDMVTKKSKEFIFDKGNDEEIVFIKFNPLFKYASAAEIAIEKKFIVGTQSPTNGGIIRMFNIDSRLDQDAKIDRTYDGFDKPIDIIFRER